MKIVFMGTPDFAVPTLRSLLEHHYDVQAVVTQPDRPKGRGRKVVASPVKQLAEQHHLLVLQPKKIRAPEALQALRDLVPDVIVVIAYGQILPESVLTIPRLGCINVHGSLLPKYRGAAPIHWAILRGEQATGVTTMFMDKGMDTGDMLLKRSVPIGAEDTAGSLHDTLSVVGADLLLETLQQLDAGTLTRIPQNDDDATYAPILKKEDGLIDWSESAETIYNTVRGLFPWPGAYTFFQDKMVKLLQTRIVEAPSDASSLPPGSVVRLEKQKGPIIATGQDCLQILQIQPQNKGPMTCSDFCRGYHLAPGDRLGA